MKCKYCNDTGRIRKANDEAKFDYWYDHFIDTGDFNSPSMAEDKAYKKVGFTWMDCPHCKANKTEN